MLVFQTFLIYGLGENTQQITVTSISTYTVTSQIVIIASKKNNNRIIERNKPAISSVDVNESTVTINLAQNEDYYEFSVNGVDYQKQMIL
jgi:hypothetical protein